MVNFGVTTAHYGGLSWQSAQLETELARRGIPQLGIRGCAYPEMARAEQVRRARIDGLEVLVFVDAHVSATVSAVTELAELADQHGMALPQRASPWALEFCAVRRDVLEAMVAQETRRYGNSPASALWGSEKVSSVPIASPWRSNGASLEPGEYLSDGEAFVLRAQNAGAVIAEHWPDGFSVKRRLMRATSVNDHKPLTDAPASRFALCVPSFGTLDADQQKAVFQLEAAGMAVHRLHDCPWIDLARSFLAERALESGRGVFFLDHDILFDPKDVVRLCADALDRQAVVAGAYCMRKSGRSIIGSFDIEPGEPLTFYRGGRIVPAYYSGLGFAAIPADILRSIRLPKLHSQALQYQLGWGASVRPWFALDCSTGFYAGEDVSFTNRVHDLSVQFDDGRDGAEPEWRLSHSGRACRVFIDTRVRLGHRGSYDYAIEDVGIVVPCFESLETKNVSTRAEARELLRAASELPIDVQLSVRSFPGDGAAA